METIKVIHQLGLELFNKQPTALCDRRQTSWLTSDFDKVTCKKCLKKIERRKATDKRQLGREKR